MLLGGGVSHKTTKPVLSAAEGTRRAQSFDIKAIFILNDVLFIQVCERLNQIIQLV